MSDMRVRQSVVISGLLVIGAGMVLTFLIQIGISFGDPPLMEVWLEEQRSHMLERIEQLPDVTSALDADSEGLGSKVEDLTGWRPATSHRVTNEAGVRAMIIYKELRPTRGIYVFEGSEAPDEVRKVTGRALVVTNGLAVFYTDSF